MATRRRLCRPGTRSGSRTLVLARGLGLGLTLLTACSRLATEVNPPTSPWASGQLLAGSARVDLTPTPGHPMGGHSFAGAHAHGAWGRLYARALVIVDPRGQPLALAVGDLWAVSTGLTDAVVESLQRDHGLTEFDRRSVIVSATHTHHSPAGIASNAAHNLAAGPALTYDPGLQAAIAQAIAQAIAEAYARREPAILRQVALPLPGIARNRSMEAFDRNPEAPEWLTRGPAAATPCAGPPGTTAAACRAASPTVFALRLEATGDQRLLGAAIFAAAHATAMANHTPVYHGDLFGVAAAAVEASLAGGGASGPTIAIFNGAEGDVSPAWRAQGYPETRRLAGLLAAGIHGLLEAPAAEVAVPTIRSRYGVFALAGRELVDPWGEPRRSASQAWMGAPAPGGAEDGPTHARVPPEGTTRRRPSTDGHGLKRKLLWIARALLPPEAPLAVVRLGSELLVTLPGEVTTILGARIRGAVAEAAETTPAHVHLIGLANTYRSYFTTPEEYDAQHYEGASTIYGRDSGMILAADLACLAAPTGPCAGRLPPPRQLHRPGPVAQQGLVDRRRPRRWSRLGLAEAAAIFERPGTPPTPPILLRFTTEVPEATALGDDAWPQITLEIADSGPWRPAPWPLADGAAAEHQLVTLVVEDHGDRWVWETRWIDPAGALARLRSALPGAVNARLRVRFRGAEIGCTPPLAGDPLAAATEAIELTLLPCAGPPAGP